jgi:hypothetical protein
MEMTVSVTLLPEVEARVNREAAKRSIPVEDYVASVVAAAVPAEGESDRRARAAAAIESLSDMGTGEKQRETFECLSKAIDEECKCWLSAERIPSGSFGWNKIVAGYCLIRNS